MQSHIRHPPIRVLQLDGDASARVYAKHFHDGAWACYETEERVVEVVSVREDDEYVHGTLPLMLSHEFLHHLLHELVDGSAYRDLDNIDSQGELRKV